ncbi:MAG: undecaprenyl/decaprenyl-phosphate alpha-N-acetylglucosaminyl 1-phosphate transferase [Solirubrobacterales bacterium]|nr:undecaprenyl/decaprenyl-phosphate alpha-N-acetylglucosaminyl 1-phosphate transferase [Solirubrobacterales bacterium]MBV9940638.1 undecaprenyl/decaprenyl-phosphate alpha-N-acetylglucosaminyl 1-phosphate transferase [Solirubrobacterales bacterium]
MSYWDALFAFLAAMAVAAVLTPLARRLAWRLGAVVMPSERGLAERTTPALGGLAILAGVLVAAAFWLPATINLHHTAGTAPGSGGTVHTWTVIVGACLITLVGVIDDIRPLAPQWKLLGQIAAALIAVEGGAVVTDVTIPFIGTLQLPNTGGVLTVIWLVGLMNVVNFSDGIDGLAAGLCTIDGIAFSIIAFDLHVSGAGVLAALTAGAALGFLFHNFYPASIFMGDSGANLLGYLLGVVAVIGSIKTGAVVTLVVPLIVLAVPFLDTGFVLAKRLKYKRKPWSADANHFHHRMARMGFSPRQTVAYLYGWTLLLAGVAVALRFVPYSNHRGSYNLGWLLVMAAIGVVALAASVYLIYLLEILKFRSRRGRELRSADPTTTEHEIDARVQREVETGDFERVG